MLFGIAAAVLFGTFVLYFWGNLRHNIHMMQLNSYYHERFMRGAASRSGRRARLILPACTVVCALLVSLGIYLPIPLFLYLILSAAVFLALRVARKKNTEIKPLVYTWRVKRLLVSASGICAVFLLLLRVVFRQAFWWALPFWLAYLNTAAYLVAAAANAVNNPLEKRIADSFVRDAKSLLAEHPGLKVVGITGSYGKTSTKNILNQLLSLDFQVLATPESYNTTMGVVRTIREKLTAAHQVFIVEMGAKKPGDIKEICDIVEPSMGILSSIGEMHLDTFKNLDNIRRTKFELARAVGQKGLMLLNYDNELISGTKLSQPVVRYGLRNEDESRELDVWAEGVESGPSGSRFDLRFAGGETISCRTGLLGTLNVLNIVAAAAAAVRLGLAPERLNQMIGRLEPVAHRLQLLPAWSGINIIDDAYNANPEGAKQALETLGGFPGYRVLITPGMVELGDREEELNRVLGGQAAACCDYIVIVGKNRATAIAEGAKGAGYEENKIYQAANIHEALAKARSLAVSLSEEEGPMTVLLENDLPDNFF